MLIEEGKQAVRANIWSAILAEFGGSCA